MTEWIDFSVYVAMIVAYWFLFAGWGSALALQMVADRNEDWLAVNGERIAKLLRGRWIVGSSWFLWSCYAWGALSIVVLLSRQIGVWPEFLSSATLGSQRWEVLKDTHSTLFIVGLVYCFGCVVVSAVRLQKDVPLAERRQASLRPRSLDDYVPRGFWMAAYAAVGVQLTAWVIAGVSGLSSAPDFWVRLAGFVAFSAIVMVIARVIVNRRASDALGVQNRRLGVRFAFAALIYGQVRFALHLYAEVAGPSFELDRAMHLALVLSVVLMTLALAPPGSKKPPRGLKPALYDPA